MPDYVPDSVYYGNGKRKITPKAKLGKHLTSSLQSLFCDIYCLSPSLSCTEPSKTSASQVKAAKVPCNWKEYEFTI